MATYDAGIVTAYGAAVHGGYTGTYEEFCAQQANYAQSAAAVEQAKQDAQTAAQAAQTAAASLEIDATLSNAGQAADAKKTGDEISALKEDYAQILDSAYATDTTSGAIASFPDGADGVPVKSLTVNIEPVQSGTGDPSPDNVRLISGHTQAVVTRTGKNLFDGTLKVGGLAWVTGEETSTSSARRSDFIPIKPSTAYFIAMFNAGGYILYDADKVRVGSKSSRPTAVFTTEATAAYIRLVLTSVASDTDTRISICESDEVTDFVPYEGDTYTIDLDGTRYGGTLDVTTGVLTVDRVMVDLGSLTWSKVTGNNYRNFTVNVQTADYSPTIPYIISDCYKSVAINAGATSDGDNYIYIRFVSSSNNAISIKDTSKADMTAAEFKAAMSGHYAVYRLKESEYITVQLSASDITTLLGQNNIWSDAGDVEVEYRADTALYIKKLTGSTEDDMVADANIVSGQYFMVGNTLYKATANIASGGAITPNVNCTSKSLPEALNEINT